ncbi:MULTISPECIES: DMT family transporter [Tenacibaculum]|uniref:DMT family transporter n=1 Tax=Tenacibaculum TaxID=104267 RepID=UPI001F0A1043|nr:MULTISPECIES: DMT family transporter [Tenacibaculum]MCH3881362.1 DMT family transporter [Tenacibaculum aquimarinum]MDO6599044.1 DMT family transporter [Tenacibaculum sp. 1_MG-2023]
MQNTHTKNISGLLLATFFISTSGVLGKYIAMPTEVVIWFRAALAMVFLYLFCKYKKIDLKIKSTKDYKPFFISGVLMAAHWVTYFYALKLSNVALGILSLYTFPIIIALLEPLFLKVKFNPIYILFGLMVLLGLYILTPELSVKSSQVKGILFGVFSAFCYAVRILILKQHVANYNGTMLMFYQTVITTILLLPTLFFMDLSGLESQFPYLLLLAFITTAVGHSLMLHSLKFFSASTASIISSLQPIFGIILAFFFLKEIPTMNTFLGGSLILATVIIESIRSKK